MDLLPATILPLIKDVDPVLENRSFRPTERETEKDTS
jgi:hypothetical protein